ncbi:MAG: RNA polymerase sigma factor [Acidimicrobiia bacterium]
MRRAPSALKARPESADSVEMDTRHQPERLGETFDDVLAAAALGADWAVAVLYRSLNRRLVRFLRAQAGGEAEDIASQVWLEVARALPRFEGKEDDFRALVFTVARRRLSDFRRTLRRRPVELVGDARLDAAARVDSAETEVIERLGGEEAARRIVELLPADQAEVVLLRVVAGLGTAEGAALVGRRPGTVRVLQHRALRRLADVLGDESDTRWDAARAPGRSRGLVTTCEGDGGVSPRSGGSAAG